MFCKWCGKKIAAGHVSCPQCGKEQGAMENGNGFWDLCSGKPNGQRPARSPEVQPTPSAGNPPAKGKMQNKGRNAFPVAVFVLGACLLLVAFLLIGKWAKKTEKCMSELEELRESISAMEEKDREELPDDEEPEETGKSTSEPQETEGETSSSTEEPEETGKSTSEPQETEGDSSSSTEEPDQTDEKDPGATTEPSKGETPTE